MSRYLFALAACALLSVCAQTVHANVFAAHLSSTANADKTYTLSYRLNQAADAGVTVKVKGPLPSTAVVRTMSLGNQTAGPQSVTWDGKNDSGSAAPSGSYTWEVTAAAAGFSSFTQISSDTNVNNAFYTAYGVDVCNNVNSPHFGEIYVCNGQAGTTGGTTARAVVDGIYILSNDQADLTNQGNTGYAGGVAWGTSASPFRCRLDADGNLFITDWSDTNSGIWIMNTNTPSANFSELFDSTGRATSGLVAGVHGSIAGCWVTGSGDSRVLYTLDEDYDIPGVTGFIGSVLKYPIGSTKSGYKTTPSIEVDDSAPGVNNLEQNYNGCIAQDANGGWWISQYRGTESAALPSLHHVSTQTTSTADWNSYVNLAGQLTASHQGAMTINPAKTRLAVGGNGFLKVLNITNFPNVTVEYSVTGQSQVSRDCAFDAAGNVYYTNSSNERLKIFSPTGANSFTTPSPTGQTLTVGAGVNEWLNY